jgi:hypothetical protein
MFPATASRTHPMLLFDLSSALLQSRGRAREQDDIHPFGGESVRYRFAQTRARACDESDFACYA